MFMEKNSQNKDFYTINEFAEKLHIHPNTVRRAIKNTKIAFVCFGTDKRRIYRIPYTEIERIIMCDLKQNIINEMKKNNEI